ncbi:DUF3563 family protein [Aurantimonas manganoxydans]|uniref:DUF3563 family protein n=1 Tax=Aurantimonas manganoxydans TaxID=651183 RepID=UPI0002EB34B1|nr:DUF3563 family protein [Aurantimonas manganoxydans]
MNITDKIRGAFSRNREQELVRAYLDQSVSMSDLERRLREVDQGRFSARSYPF